VNTRGGCAVGARYVPFFPVLAPPPPARTDSVDSGAAGCLYCSTCLTLASLFPSHPRTRINKMPVSPYPALGTAPAPAPGPGAGAVPAAAAATAPRPHPSIFAHGNHAIPTAATSTSTTASEYPHHPSFYQHDFLPQLPTVVSVAKEVNKATQLVVEGGARKVTCQISVCFFFLLTLWRSRLGLFFPAALLLSLPFCRFDRARPFFRSCVLFVPVS